MRGYHLHIRERENTANFTCLKGSQSFPDFATYAIDIEKSEDGCVSFPCLEYWIDSLKFLNPYIFPPIIMFIKIFKLTVVRSVSSAKI